jgi:hypothetical protein
MAAKWAPHVLPAMAVPALNKLRALREEAFKIAQRNAALPTEAGGLGLPQGNTAMDRADVMFPGQGWHGTSGDIREFDLSRGGQASGSQAASLGVSVADESPELAAEFANLAASKHVQEGSGANVLPLRFRWNRAASMNLPENIKNIEMAATIQDAQEAGYDLLKMNNYTTPSGRKEGFVFLKNPNQIRSLFAAFDPARINSKDLLATAAGASLIPYFLRKSEEQ